MYLWSVLYASGYLTDDGKPENGIHKFVIPNQEVRGIYEKRIRSWFQSKVISDTSKWKDFCEALEAGEYQKVERLFNDFMSVSISIRDTSVRKEMKENLPTGKASTKGSKGQNPSACFYHGMLLGLLQAEGNWNVRSNAESGIGYTDIRLKVPTTKVGCVIEVKYAEDGKYDQACAEAMRQIEDGGYVENLKLDGMQVIRKYGIACYKKSCRIEYGAE